MCERIAMACTLSNSINRTNGFDFAKLFDVYQYLDSTCAPNSEIFFRGTRILTNDVCLKITGNSNSIWSGWTPYPVSDIWTRLVVWKLPLLQLVSQFPRPPLGWKVETAVMLHLLGDPIDSIGSMLLTLVICRAKANKAKELCNDAGMKSTHAEYHRTWKQLAIILVSYGECGASAKADNFAQV
jgi:hypothetical protein